MRFLAPCTVLLSLAAAANLRTAAPPAKASKTAVPPAKASKTRTVAPSGTADGDLKKVQSIRQSLQVLAKQAHAPNGTADLLNLLKTAEGDLQVAGSSKEKRAAVMKRVNADMAAFQAKLMKRSLELKKAAAADEAKKVEALKPIAKKMQARLDRINTQEKDLRARVKSREQEQVKEEKEEAKLKDNKVSKEDQKTRNLLKYINRKNQRQLKKKTATWAAERKALNDGIRLAKAGDAEGTRAAMQRVIAAEKGSSFIY